MNRLALLLLALSAAACDGSATPGPALFPPAQPTPLPTPTPPPPPGVASVRDVTPGETVEAVIGDGQTLRPGEHHFFVTVPTSGTLEASLRWDPFALGTLLMLRLADLTVLPSRPDYSPVVARRQVEAGNRYLIVVAVAGADWIPHDRFVLTTRLEL